MLYKVLITDKIDPAGTKILKSNQSLIIEKKYNITAQTLKRIIQDYHIIIIKTRTRLTASIINKGKKLKIIARVGVGLDNIDVIKAREKGIIVLNTPESNKVSTSEFTLGLLLALSRNIVKSNIEMNRSNWNRKKWIGSLLQGKKIGIIGLGRIGKTVAMYCRMLGMEIYGYDRLISRKKCNDIGINPISIKKIFEECDFISLHIPLNWQTKNIITKKEIKFMKSGCQLINCARGGIINELDLIDALDKKNIAGAALDVFEKEPPKYLKLFSHHNLITTPHIGAATYIGQKKVTIEICNSVIKTIKKINNKKHVYISISSKIIKQFFQCAERSGLLFGQLNDSFIYAIELSFTGKIWNESNTEVWKSIFIKSVISSYLEENIIFDDIEAILNNRGIVIKKKLHLKNIKNNRIKIKTNDREVTVLLSNDGNIQISMIDKCKINFLTKKYVLIINKKKYSKKVKEFFNENSIKIVDYKISKNNSKYALFNLNRNLSKDLLTDLNDFLILCRTKIIYLYPLNTINDYVVKSI